jgi:hypothetical protein
LTVRVLEVDAFVRTDFLAIFGAFLPVFLFEFFEAFFFEVTGLRAFFFAAFFLGLIKAVYHSEKWKVRQKGSLRPGVKLKRGPVERTVKCGAVEQR